MVGQATRETLGYRESEAQFQKRITDLCDWLHLKWHHETDSRKSKKGWPDLVIAGPSHVIFVELKTETGKVSAEQREWLDILASTGATVLVWRPSDWPHAERILRRMAGNHGNVVAGNG